MVLEAIRGLNLDDFQHLYFVYLQEHEDRHRFLKGFCEELEDDGLLDRSVMIALETQTRDQPETVYRAILQQGIQGPIFIKDSDNYFEVEVFPENCICCSDLNSAGLIKPRNKSYILVDERSSVVNIVEKRVISSQFSAGGYGFGDASVFCRTLDRLGSGGERYISNVIYQLLLEGEHFQAKEVRRYSDWGTIEDWDRFRRSFATLFVDLDGTLLYNASAHFPPYPGESGPIEANVAMIRQLVASGKFQLIVTTSRPEKFRSVTEAQLEQLGLQWEHLLMGMYHSKRIIVNDYSPSNPYKSCDAINLRRDSDELREILRESLGIDYEDI